jgi:hypothetical protein
MKKFIVVSHSADGKEVVRKEFEAGVDEFVVWKLGNNDRPATQDDINDFQKLLTDALEIAKGGEVVNIVTHHALNVERVQFQPGCCVNGCCQTLPLESPDDLLERANAELDELQAIDDDLADDEPQNPQ